MKYAKIDEFEMVNGVGCGVSLYVQGCWFQCPGCFNSETWDFNGGQEWTTETETKFIELASQPYIQRISILGGEPLADENLRGVSSLINKIRSLVPNKTIWLYTGYNMMLKEGTDVKDDFWNDEDDTFTYIQFIPKTNNTCNYMREFIAHNVDVIVDGCFKEDEKNLALAFRGSSNQRVIDVQASLKSNEIILFRE